jgi:hypothetical protein
MISFIYQLVILCFTQNAELNILYYGNFISQVCLIIILKKINLTQPFYG